MSDEPLNVLFLCTHNSARSVIAEVILNKLSRGKFRAYSAGSQPSGTINPHALQMLGTLGYDVSGLRSKSWQEFAKPGAPALDFVFTVCDNAAGETCPVWPGQPMTAHWGIETRPRRATQRRPSSRTPSISESHSVSIGAAACAASKGWPHVGTKLRDIGRMEGATARAKEQS